MASLSKRTFSCEDLVNLLLGVKSLDVEAYRALLEKEEGARTDEVAEILSRDRSTAHRSLQRLVNCELAVKEKRTSPGRMRGGYFYVYRPVTPKNVQETVERCLDEWYMEMRRAVDEVEDECLC